MVSVSDPWALLGGVKEFANRQNRKQQHLIIFFKGSFSRTFLVSHTIYPAIFGICAGNAFHEIL